MTVFSAAIDAIFADPNMAADALHRKSRSSIDTPCRVILSLPDGETDYGSAAIVSDTHMIEVRIAEIAALTAGDRFSVDGEVLIVQGEPLRDRLRLVWKCEAVPLDRRDA